MKIYMGIKCSIIYAVVEVEYMVCYNDDIKIISERIDKYEKFA